MKQYQKILDFWFGNLNKSEAPSEDKRSLWFTKSDETDKEIQEKFSAYFEGIKAEKYNDWLNDTDKCLALIILTDQFTRNIYRNKPESFSYDHIALASALKAIENGFDKEYHFIKRVFFYMPLEHSENIEIQKKNVQLFQDLLDSSQEDFKKTAAFYKDYADKHYQIIERFGRFPHRNKILGRESTPEEIAFLETPGSSF